MRRWSILPAVRLTARCATRMRGVRGDTCRHGQLLGGERSSSWRSGSLPSPAWAWVCWPLSPQGEPPFRWLPRPRRHRARRPVPLRPRPVQPPRRQRRHQPDALADGTPAPAPALVPAPLTGRRVSPAVAKRHPVAVMIDDLRARPQSGFNAASVVWQAPAEGGIPRYMMIFRIYAAAAGRPGPQRALLLPRVGSRVEGASTATPAARRRRCRRCRRRATASYVYNADEFRWGGALLPAHPERFAPHNVYTSGKQPAAAVATGSARRTGR